MDQKKWKNTDDFQGEKIIGICKGCAFLQKRDDVEWCIQPSCFRAKEAAFQQQYLEQASLLSGIPVLEVDRSGYSESTSFEYGKEVKLEKIRTARCENLRLKFDGYTRGKSDTTHLGGDGFPMAQIVCNKREQYCTCLKALEAGVKIEASEDGAALAKEDLQEINRQIRAQKRYNAKVKKDLIVQASQIVLAGLENNVQKVWEAIFQEVVPSYSEDAAETKKSIKDGTASLADVKYGIAYALAHHAWSDEPKEVVKQLNENLVKLGLDPLDISFEAPIATPSPQTRENAHLEGEEPAGMSLMEVFAEEADANGIDSK
jgi:hypothetical protein